MDDDDWDLSAEDLDSLERDALQQLSRSRDVARDRPRSPVPAPGNAGWSSTRVGSDSRPNKVFLPAASFFASEFLFVVTFFWGYDCSGVL